MASESITFSFLSQGADKLAGDFKKTGDNAAAAARGAKVLQDTIKTLGDKENRTAAESANLAKALRLTGDAEDRAAAKALAAEIAISRLNESMKKSSASTGSARGGFLGLAGEITGFGSAADAAASGGSKFKLALAGLSLATGVLEPAVAALGVAVGAVAAGTVAAGIGLGGFMAVAKSQIAPVTKAMQAQAAAVRGGAAAQKTYKAALAALTPVQRELLTSLTGVKTEFKTWSDSLARPVLTPILAALKLVNPLLKDMSPFVMAAASAIGVLVGKLSAAVRSTGFQQWLQTMLPLVKPVIVDIGTAIGHIVTGIGGMLAAFAPFTTEVLGGLDTLTKKFAAWGTTLSSHSGFNAMIAEFRQNWPLVKTGLGELATIVKNILSAMAGLATGANSKALWQVANPLLALVAGLSSHPAVVRSLLYLLAAIQLAQKAGGVVSLGVKVVGAGQKLLDFFKTGTWTVGAAGMQTAGDTMLLAAKNMQAAADVMAVGGKSGGAGGIGGGAAAGATAGKAAGGGFLAAFRAAITPAAAGVLAGALIRAAGDTLSPAGTFAGNLNKQFQSDGHLWSTSLLHSFTFGGLEAWLTAKIGLPVGKAMNNVAGFVHGSWTKTKNDTTSIWGSISGFLSGSWHKMLGDSSHATTGVRNNFSGMSDTILGAMRRAGQATDAFRTRNLLPVLGTAGRVSGGIQGLQRTINLLHGKTVSVGAHLSGSGGVQVTPSTGAPGAKNYAVYFKPLAAGGQVSGGIAGRDSVPAILTPGEVVVPAPMVKAGAVNHLKGRLPGFAAGGLVGNLAADTGADAAGEAKAGLAAIVAAMRKAILQALVPSTGYIYRAGSGVAQWRGVVQQALGLAGANVAQLTDPVLYQMQTESGGNPTIVNRTDSNWLAGHPSVGLMQVIRGTYAQYAGRFRNTGPFEYGVSVNPLANVYAAIRYAQAAYGPGLRNAYGGIGTGHGYDRGGWLPTGTSIAVNNTGRPEQVIPPGGTAAGGAVHLHLTVNGPIGSQSELEDWFIRTANKAARHGRLSQAVKAASR